MFGILRLSSAKCRCSDIGIISNVVVQLNAIINHFLGKGGDGSNITRLITVHFITRYRFGFSCQVCENPKLNFVQESLEGG